MKRLVLVVATVLLAGCGRVATDGHVFMKSAPPVNTSMRLTVVTHSTVADLRKHSRGVAVDPSRRLMAFAVVRNGVCEIHTIDPKIIYEPEWLGHELTHCIYGRWHK